jgi:hypothetical protein
MVIDVNGIELYWEETGGGDPLLWLTAVWDAAPTALHFQ